MKKERQVRKGRSETSGLNLRVGFGVRQRQRVDPIRIGRQLTARLAAGDRVRDSVEFVEEAWNRVA